MAEQKDLHESELMMVDCPYEQPKEQKDEKHATVEKTKLSPPQKEKRPKFKPKQPLKKDL